MSQVVYVVFLSQGGWMGKKKKEPGRNVHRAVLRTLRREVAFHCPVPTGDGVCGNPYLTWHHFDPPWRVEKHHRVSGMIALCQEHATKADNGAYTDDQLRCFKREALDHLSEISGRFDWMRQDLIAYVGGNFFHRTPIIAEWNGQPLVWFTRNERDEWMVNYEMLPASAERTRIVDNVWQLHPGDVEEVICPPGGRTLEVQYNNGDHFKTEFQAVATSEEFVAKFPAAEWLFGTLGEPDLEYPVTVVSITHVTALGIIQLYPHHTVGPGNNGMSGCWIGNPSGAGISITTAPDELQVDQIAEVMRIEMGRRRGQRKRDD